MQNRCDYLRSKNILSLNKKCFIHLQKFLFCNQENAKLCAEDEKEVGFELEMQYTVTQSLIRKKKKSFIT